MIDDGSQTYNIAPSFTPRSYLSALHPELGSSLTHACRNGFGDLASKILDRRADFSLNDEVLFAKDKAGHSALDIARKNELSGVGGAKKGSMSQTSRSMALCHVAETLEEIAGVASPPDGV